MNPTNEPTRVIDADSAWRISYTYDNPSNAGPFRGRDTVKGDKPVKGDSHYGIFGMATIKTVSRAK